MTDLAEDLRCAAQMHAAGTDPIGTAGSYDGYLLVEWPLPWPHDLSEVPELAPVRAALAEHGAGIRLQGLVPTGTDRRRVILHRRPDGPFAGYVRRELEVAAGGDAERPTARDEAGRRLGEAAAALLGPAATTPGAAGATPVAGDGRDVLICTHGRRDRCCGSFGTELWQELATDPSTVGSGSRLWRTSHTGGHRYAATMVVLPEGTVWGFVDAASALRVLRRDGPITDVLDGYRGCAGLPSPHAQALERAVLAEIGWGLLDTPRRTEAIGGDRMALIVDPDGTPERWEGTVAPGRVVPLAECGAPPAAGGKTLTETLVTGAARVA